jgi:hypothetical protein
MPFLSGIILEIEQTKISNSGNWYTKGILEDSDKALHDFCIFWKDETCIKEFLKFQKIDLVGKRDRKEGSFLANYVRDPNDKSRRNPSATHRADETYRGEDAIDGKKPIDFILDQLGATRINNELKAKFGSYSSILEGEGARQEYKKMLSQWLIEAKEIKEFKEMPF